MLIVCDTSPIINLAIIDHLWLLPKIYGQIIIPQTVYDEIVVAGAGEAGADDVRLAKWIEVRHCRINDLWERLKKELDPGEAEAIALAFEIQADRILIDERKGRQKAIELLLKPVGVLGVLLRAKQDNLISEVTPLITHYSLFPSSKASNFSIFQSQNPPHRVYYNVKKRSGCTCAKGQYPRHPRRENRPPLLNYKPNHPMPICLQYPN